MKIAAFSSQGVLGTGRDFGVTDAGDDAVRLKVVEALGKGAGVDVPDRTF